MSQFDPQAFLDATIDAPLERRAPLSVQDYRAVLGELTSRAWTYKDGSKSGIAWDVPAALEVPAELQAALSLPPTITLKDSIMLDLTATGAIDVSKGKNNRLRMYREAVDMNKPGDSFSARKDARRFSGCHLGSRFFGHQPGQLKRA